MRYRCIYKKLVLLFLFKNFLYFCKKEIIEEEESSQYSNRVYPEQVYPENTNYSVVSGNSLISQMIEGNDASSIMTDEIEDDFDW